MPDIPDISYLFNTSTPRGQSSYDDIINRNATRTGVDPNLIRAVIGQESQGNPTARSPKGAGGLMQLMPGTAQRFGVTNVNDPEQNIRGGSDYLKFLSNRYGGDIDKTLAGYNAGEGAVDKFGGIPPYKETQAYVPAVKQRYQKLTGQAPQPQQPTQPQEPSGSDISYLFQKPGQPAQPTQPAQRPMRRFGTAPQQPQEGAFAGVTGGFTRQRRPAAQPSMAGAGVQGEAQAAPGQTPADTLRAAGRMAAMGTGIDFLPQSAQDVLTEQVAGRGLPDILRTASGAIKYLPGAYDPLAKGTQAQQTQTIRAPLNQYAGQLEQGAAGMAKQSGRGQVAQAAENLIGGGIGSAPAFALQALGMPATAAFGLDAFLKAEGRDADFWDVLKQTGVGAASGALWDLPVPAKADILRQLGQRLGGRAGEMIGSALTKAGIVGGGTTAIGRAAGQPLGEAATTGAMMGLAAGGGQLIHGAFEPGPEAISGTQVPDINAALAAREAAVQPSLQGTPEGNIPELRSQLRTRAAERLPTEEPASEPAPEPTARPTAPQPQPGEPLPPLSARNIPQLRTQLRARQEELAARREGVRHVDLQAREDDGTFREETPQETAARQEAVAGQQPPSAPTPVKPGIPPEAATTPIGATTATRPGERAFPQTLTESGRTPGTDLTYDVVTNPQSRAAAQTHVDQNGIEGSLSALRNPGGGAQRTALGIELVDRATQAARQAEAQGDTVQAGLRYAQAGEAASLASRNLTSAGQEVQAAQIANRYTPEGAVREAARIADSQGAQLAPETVRQTASLAQAISDSNQRMADLEQTVNALKAGRQPSPVRPGRIETAKDYFLRTENEARARLEARRQQAQAELTNLPRGQRGAAINPVAAAADIADWTIIGASKIARGGLNYAQWQADMIRDFGDQIRPHLEDIFQNAKTQVDERRAQATAEARQRTATRKFPDQSLEDALQSLNAERATNRQARTDLERHFRDLQRDNQRGNLDAVLSLTRDSLLSARGFLRLLSGMGAKQAIDFGSRLTEAGLDVSRATVTGGPRTTSAPSFGTVLRTVGGFAERAPGAVKSAFLGKPSEVMPEAYPAPRGESPYVTYAVRIMQKLYGTKEAAIRSWAYPVELQTNARTFALNDLKDGLISRGQVDAQARNYAQGRVEFDGPSNQALSQSLARQAAEYEVQSKQIIPSMKDVRAREMMQSPSELLHSVALQGADKAVYAQPSAVSTRARQLFGQSTGGQIAQNVLLPFSKRPANNIADNLFGYTGLKTIPEGGKLIKQAINSEVSPAQVRAFNQAVAKGSTGFAVMAIGALLNSKGILTAPSDKAHPTAIHVGGDYYSIQNVPVVGWLLGMGAAYQQDGVKAVPAALGQMIIEHPLMRAAKTVTDTASKIIQSRSVGKGLSQFAGQTAARLIPAPVKIAAEASDTQERDTRTRDLVPSLITPSQASIPGWRQQLPAEGEKSPFSVVNPFYRPSYRGKR
jgi:hypothetical protein